MIKEEKINFLKQSYGILESLTKEINQKIEYAKEGVAEDNVNLIIGSLVGIDKAAEHLKDIFETMLFVHRN